MSLPTFDPELVRGRQQRFANELARRGCGLGVLVRPESIQWLTGSRVGPLFTPVAAITAEAKVTLVLPARKVESPAVADNVRPYAEKRLSTMRDLSEQQHAALEALFDAMPATSGKAACEFSLAPQTLRSALPSESFDIDAVMFRLRRRKDADELAMMAYANRANRRMYERARKIVAPGLNELDLYAELHAAAVAELREPLTYLGQDFRSNARGGAPRDRVAEVGELWILDLGVGYRGYYSDNARTLAVGEPSDAQREAHRRIAEVFPMIESRVRPGVRCREVFDEASKMLAGLDPWVFNHHLGHGVGLAPHEAPRLNPNWDDEFQPGDFFTAEPGLYADELRHGIRLEQNYMVTEDGVELLTDWPLGL